MKMLLEETLKVCDITLEGTPINKEMIADAISDEIEATDEKVILYSYVLGTLCRCLGVTDRRGREKISNRYLNSNNNPEIKTEYGIQTFTVRELVVELAKEGHFGKIDLRNGDQIRIKRLDEGVTTTGSITVFAKSRDKAREYVKNRTMLLPPIHNIGFSGDPVIDPRMYQGEGI